MQTLLALLIIAIGSLGQSSSYVPINKIHQWSWETFWLTQGLFAWLILPLLGALLGCPKGTTLLQLYAQPGTPLIITYGILWGIGGLTFGLSMRYLGVALGQSIALGTCSAFGTLLPPLLAGTNLLKGQGPLLLTGVALTIAGIAIIGYAGSLRSQSMTPEQRHAAVKDYALTKGLIVALLCGIMSACFALGLNAGNNIKQAALNAGVNPLYAGLPVVALITLGGLLTNAAYCLQQNLKHHTFHDYTHTQLWAHNIPLCALAGLLWYSQFFGLETAKSLLTNQPTLLAFSWSILMALNVTFSNLWGLILKEWKGTSKRTITTLLIGLLTLIASILIVSIAQQ